MKKKTYFMFVHENESGLWCEFPDLEGCMTDGDNLEGLMKNAAEALESWMESVIGNGDSLPEASSSAVLKEKMKDADEEVAFIVPVTGYLPSVPARINVTSTADKIEEITDFAKKIGKTRSELMVKATLDYISSRA